tara:strand:- start:175 stop:450 length:276 start_codon:yes stop_codon:yes gene_type:complete
MDYTTIVNNIGSKVSFNINNTPVIATIESCNETEDNSKWVTFTLEPEYKDFMPIFWNIPLRSFNSLYYPVEKRTYKGWYSDEVFNSLKLIQ